LGLKLGKRKILALVIAGLIGAVSFVAWRFGGTDGLLAVLLVTFLASIGALAWFTSRLERRIRLLITKLESASREDRAEQDERLQGLNHRFDELEAQASRPGEQAEKLLLAINARFTRAELTQERMVAMLRESGRTDSPGGRPE